MSNFPNFSIKFLYYYNLILAPFYKLKSHTFMSKIIFYSNRNSRCFQAIHIEISFFSLPLC